MGHKGKGVLIGHLDTGVDGEHPAFKDRIAGFNKFGYRGSVATAMAPHDSGRHGTHTAGLLIGNSKEKFLGIAPEALLYSGMVIEEGNIVSRILKGLDWLLDCKVQIVNLSLGIFTDTPIFRFLIQKMIQHEMLVVCSLGNRGAGKASAPGFYPETIAVGSLNANGRVASYSGSYHHNNTTKCHKPDLIAPGDHILSTTSNDGFEHQSGTSMSSAQIAGLAALLRGSFPHATSIEIKTALLKSCDPLDPLQSHRSVRGMVRPLKAFNLLKNRKQNQLAQLAGFSDWELEYPKKYIDPRLENKLNLVGEKGKCEAIFQFTNAMGVHQLEQMVNKQSSGNESKLNFSSLKNAPIAIYRGSSQSIRTIIDWPNVCIANACDVSRYMSIPLSLGQVFYKPIVG